MSKSIKFKNDTYLDTSSIMHNRNKLSDLLGTKPLCFKNTSSRDFNDYYEPGIYMVGGQYSNAPVSYDIYGVIIVITNNGDVWRKTETDSWLWQILMNTTGSVYLRTGINETVPRNWVQLH